MPHERRRRRKKYRATSRSALPPPSLDAMLQRHQEIESSWREQQEILEEYPRTGYPRIAMRKHRTKIRRSR